MRDYSKVSGKFWTDHLGRIWPVVRSCRRLKFKYPAHAALRAFVFLRDGFQCVRCGALAIDIPEKYDGKDTLFTNTALKDGSPDVLVADHILTLNAGGLSVIHNLQTLCQTCNKQKIKEDNVASMSMRGAHEPLSQN